MTHTFIIKFVLVIEYHHMLAFQENSKYIMVCAKNTYFEQGDLR